MRRGTPTLPWFLGATYDSDRSEPHREYAYRRERCDARTWVREAEQCGSPKRAGRRSVAKREPVIVSERGHDPAAKARSFNALSDALISETPRRGDDHCPHTPWDAEGPNGLQFRHGTRKSPIGYANPDAVTQIANGLARPLTIRQQRKSYVGCTGARTKLTTLDYANSFSLLFAMAPRKQTYGYDAWSGVSKPARPRLSSIR